MPAEGRHVSARTNDFLMPNGLWFPPPAALPESAGFALIDRPLVATIHLVSHPVTDSLKRRPGVEIVHVDEHSRAGLPEQLSARLLAALGKAGA